MYRIILVDDEPLILAGIASLIKWEDYDCVIVGKATNGSSAYDMIIELKPDIIITDIRMPVLSGLELIEQCKNHGCTFAFLVLTNLEEFQLVRKALSLGASDYLVKIDLTAEALVEALKRGIESCDLLVRQQRHQLLDSPTNIHSLDIMKNYLSQLLFAQDSPSGVPAQIMEQYQKPFLILFALRPDNTDLESEDTSNLLQLDQQITDILGGISVRTFAASTLLLYHANTYLLAASLKESDSFHNILASFCTKTLAALKTYFELTAVFGISSQLSSISELPTALEQAQVALDYYYYDSTTPYVFYQGQTYHESITKSFNINFLKKDLSASIQQNDNIKLETIFEQIIDLFVTNKPNKEHATSACINIYTYLYSFFESEDGSYQDIFPYTINIADQLGHFNSLTDILEWLQNFCDKLAKLLVDRKETRSDKLVEQAKRYIDAHYTEKLTLTIIADKLNISSGHLSNTFKKYTGSTLSDHIAEVKIAHAKELIATHKYLMYEVSEILGFDNPYYFSKVFKKITGLSPREHEKRTF